LVFGLFNYSDLAAKFRMGVDHDVLGRNVEVGRYYPGIRLGNLGKTPDTFHISYPVM
jgi:hypothetical protein